LAQILAGAVALGGATVPSSGAHRAGEELRDGEPGPILGRDAGFWLHGTGVRALRNPGRRTARVRIVTPKGQDRHIPVNTPRTPGTE